MSKDIFEYAIVTRWSGAAKAAPDGKILARNARATRLRANEARRKRLRFFAVESSALWSFAIADGVRI
jgi:hypothetical protein